MEMEQRLSLITLGVTDVAAARAFYEALGFVRSGRANVYAGEERVSGG